MQKFTPNQYLGLGQQNQNNTPVVQDFYDQQAPQERIRPLLLSNQVQSPVDGLMAADTRMEYLNRKEKEVRTDSRYYNKDGTNKSVADIQEGFAKADAARNAASEKHKLQQFARFSDFITSQTPDKDGYVKLDSATAGRLPEITEGFTGIDNPKDLKVRFENGHLKLYGDGKPLDIMNPREDVVRNASQIGSVINQQELKGLASKTGGIYSNTKGKGKLTDKQKAVITTARNEIKTQKSIEEQLVIDGVSADDPRLVNALRKRRVAEKALTGITSTNNTGITPKQYDYRGLSAVKKAPEVSTEKPTIQRPNKVGVASSNNEVVSESELQPSDRSWYNPDISQPDQDKRKSIGFNDGLRWIARQNMALPR